MRSSIIAHTTEDAGLRKILNITADLKKVTSQLQTFIDFLKRNINPFDSNLNLHKLFNISTGKVAPANVTENLLHAEEKGIRKRFDFIVKSSEDPEHFERSIPQSKH